MNASLAVPGLDRLAPDQSQLPVVVCSGLRFTSEPHPGPSKVPLRLTQIKATARGKALALRPGQEREAAMATPTYIVHAEAGADGEARIRLAARLARQFEAMLIGVAAQDIVPPVTSTAAGAVLVAALMTAQEKTIERDLKAAHEAFRLVTANEPCPTEWRQSIALPVEALAREARGTDLIILGRKPDGPAGRSRHPDPADVLMHSGRPILLSPPGMDHLNLSSVVIAWKDTRESRRAVMDSIPLLRHAERVAVIAVKRDDSEQDETQAAVDDVAAYLTRHEIPASGHVRMLRQPTVPEELLLAAEQHDAGLMVAGGYGHTRIQEFVLGGVTRTLLRHYPKCCLLSH